MLSNPKLVGRDAEVTGLDLEFRRAAAGEFRVVLLAGDSGVGKTRLAREFLARKRDRAIGLVARGYPLGGTDSFGIWAEALERHLRALGREEVATLCGGFLDDLAFLLRSVAAVRGAVSGSPPSRLRLLSGLAILVSNLTRRAPVILLIDDAHDADPSSWETLGYLAGDLSEARVLVLAAARPYELAGHHVATEVLLRLEQEDVMRRMELNPLDRTTLGKLAESALRAAASPALVDWLATRSRGNPLFALGLVQALVDEGADLSAPELRSIPEQLADRVVSGLRKLDAPAVDLADSLATIGRRVGLRELAGLSGLTAERLAGILEQLVRSRLLIEESRGQDISYEIAHPLVQEAIYQQMGASRRQQLHRTLGRALLASGRHGEAAPHFLRSADVGDDEAIDALRDAVRQAEAQEAYREALTILGALVELIPAGDQRWLDVLKALAWDAEWVADHRADTHALLGIEAMKAIDLVLEHAPETTAHAVVKFRLANFLGWGTGDLDDAAEACLQAQALFARAGDRASVLLAGNELAWIHGLRGSYPAMEAAAEAVAADAEAGGQRFALIQGLHAKGIAAVFRGRFREAEAALRSSNLLAEKDGKVYRLTVGRAILGLVAAAEGRAEEAAEFFAEGKRVNPAWRDSILPEWECIAHWFAGDLRAAVACANDAATRTSGELSKRRAIGVIFAALAAAETGDAAQAQRHLARARRAYGDRDWQFFSHYCGHAQGVLDWQAGRLSKARAYLCETSAHVLATGAHPFAALVLVDLAELAEELRDPGLAVEAERRLQAIANSIDCGLYRALAAIGSACAALAADSRHRAVDAARSAIDLLAGSGWRLFHARALERLGRSLACRDRARAVDALGRSAALFDACGAVWRRDRVRAGLRGLGAQGRRAAAAVLGPEALTRRERQVVHLAVQGLMAAQIGEQLSISERTVEAHLAAAYLKLGVRSKIELIRRASEFGLN